MKLSATRISLGTLLIAAPVLANAAFTGLGSTFSYPQVLQFAPSQIFVRFSQQQTAIMSWFAVLAIGAGLLAPISVLLRTFGLRRKTMWVGIAAAFVQVVGLSRWLLLVPGIVARGDEAAFVTVHALLGTALGEGAGYMLTALWSVLVLRDLDGKGVGRALRLIGSAAAVLILSGILIPFGAQWAVLANFAGYVLWSVWLVVLGVQVLRKKMDPRGTADAR